MDRWIDTAFAAARKHLGGSAKLLAKTQLKGGFIAEHLFKIEVVGPAGAIHNFVFKTVDRSELLSACYAGDPAIQSSAPPIIASHFSPADTEHDQSWILMPFIDGPVSTFDDQVPPEIVRFLARLHARSEHVAARPGWTWTYDSAHMRRTIINAAKAVSACATPALASHLHQLEHSSRLISLADELPKMFCHGDVHPGNIIASPDGRHWLIDWGGACIAPPTLDVANLIEFGSSNWELYSSTLRAEGLTVADEVLAQAYQWARAATALGYLPWIAQNTDKAPAMVEQIITAAERVSV